MSREPWFKFWAADYLTDGDVAKVPPEGRELLVRVWCLCNLRGSAPADLEELSLATGLKLSYVSYYVSYIISFFANRDGQLFSLRMEREKEKSDKARKSVSYRKDRLIENRTTNRTTKTAYDSYYSESQKSESQKNQSQTLLLNDGPVEREDDAATSVIYKAYPRHVAPKPAKKAIGNTIKELTRAGAVEYRDKTGELIHLLLPTRATAETFVLDAVREYALSPKGRGEFVPYGQKWFNQQRYTDDRREWHREANGNGNGNGNNKRSDREASARAVIARVVGDSDEEAEQSIRAH